MTNHCNACNLGKSTFSYAGLIVFMMVLFFGNLKAQPIENQVSDKEHIALNRAIRMYDQAIGRNSFLYTGKNYYNRHDQVQGHPFFTDDYWEYGSIIFENQRFDSIYLKYDVYDDLLLVEHFSSSGIMTAMQIHKPKVSGFELFGHRFLQIMDDSTAKIKPGFYDNLYDGNNVQLLCKWKKELVKNMSAGSYSEEFMDKQRFFIVKGGEYFPVRNRSSLIKILEDQKKEIKRFIRQNKVRYFNNNTQLYIEVASYYDSLTGNTL